MKVFIVAMEWDCPDGSGGMSVEVFNSKEKAEEYMKLLIKDTKDMGYDNHYRDEDTYSAYTEGEYSCNHTNITLEEKEIKGD